MSAYQRDLVRHMLGPALIYCALVALIVVATLAFASRWPSNYWAWGAMGATYFAIFLPMGAFRRNVTLLSRAHGLICSACGAALGFKYATLKRTGRCGVCGAKVVG